RPAPGLASGWWARCGQRLAFFIAARAGRMSAGSHFHSKATSAPWLRQIKHFLAHQPGKAAAEE
ncbi:hypothetical protein, partial [Comamonas aquatica]